VDELANQLDAYRKRHYDVASKIEILKPLKDVPVNG
jgi:hypothetical protein